MNDGQLLDHHHCPAIIITAVPPSSDMPSNPAVVERGNSPAAPWLSVLPRGLVGTVDAAHLCQV